MKIEPTKTNQRFKPLTRSEILGLDWVDDDAQSLKKIYAPLGIDMSIKELNNALLLHGIYSTEHRDPETGKMFLKINMQELRHQEAFIDLEEEPGSFSGGVYGYGVGPEPKMEEIDVIAAKVAEESLHEANRRNNEAGAINHGVSPEHSETLLRYITQRSRNQLFSKDGADTSNPDKLFGACGLGQGLVGHQAELLGIKTYYHQVGDLSKNSTHRHAFNVVEIPVEVDGVVSVKPYIVDTTFRQFFVSQSMSFTDGTLTPSWGAQLTSTEAGKKLANDLLRDGYAELTEENAKLYVGSQAFSLDDDTKLRLHTDWEASAPVQALRSNTIDNDYYLEEFIDWGYDVRTPSMVYENKPMSAILDKPASPPFIEQQPVKLTSPKSTPP